MQLWLEWALAVSRASLDTLHFVLALGPWPTHLASTTNQTPGKLDALRLHARGLTTC